MTEKNAAGVRSLPAGDSAVSVEFGNEISEEINAKVAALDEAAAAACIDGFRETVPTYRSLTVHYDPEKISFAELCGRLGGLMGELGESKDRPKKVLCLPVLYGGEEGPDMANVCGHSGLSEEDVVRIHSSADYRVYMLGFTPGFPYLGGMDERLATPRLASPRTVIPAGSVGIAGIQTGVYPVNSPGGWQLIGRTPVRLYDAGREKPILPEAGQYIRFVPVDRARYEEIEREVEEGRYEPVYDEAEDHGPGNDTAENNGPVHDAASGGQAAGKEGSR